MDSCSHINEISFNIIGEWTLASERGVKRGLMWRGGTQTGARREKNKTDSHPENLSHNIIRGWKLRRIEPWPSSKKKKEEEKSEKSAWESSAEIKASALTHWATGRYLVSITINSFTTPACKMSGLKDARTRLQTVYFSVLEA